MEEILEVAVSLTYKLLLISVKLLSSFFSAVEDIFAVVILAQRAGALS